MLKSDAKGEPAGVVKLGRGDVLGEIEVLPPRPAGSAGQVILSRQGGSLRAKATDFTVVIQLMGSRLSELMLSDPRMEEQIDSNLNKWTNAVRPASLATADWLFGCCPPEVLAALAVVWKPAVFNEGEVLVDLGVGSAYKEMCSIVLSGRVQLTTRHLRGEHAFDVEQIVSEGGVINAISLLGSEDEHGDFGLEVVAAEAIESTYVLMLVRTQGL